MASIVPIGVRKVRRTRVLVVDDEPALAGAIRRALSTEHDVVLVEGGRDALAVLTNEDFDIVLCDLMLHDMTGMELFGRLLHARPEIAERLMFMTGGAVTPEARRFVDEYSHRCIRKPFELSVLRAMVRERLGGPFPPSGTSERAG